ncbi:ATP-binding protein [Psychromicrobium xiongbiense]|uniref:ATP-binding protein n=1 Tax=Psychromicrobium xiongbiense TaxID=3051184 RepID=UPI002555D554|nr:DUF87 domain-containing protein [Psychromicrobium sp. YIM S02556]
MATSDARRRRLGTIVDVSAERFRVEMTETADGYTLVGFDGQHYVARIGSLVLIPLTNAYVVAEVTGLQERPDSSSVSSASRSLEDITQASSRQLSLAPLGTLPFDESGNFSFGVSEFPPLYGDVLHVENRDLDRILNVAHQEVSIPGSNATKLNSLTVGTSVVFNDYEVKVRINDFFGAHSAILGNTGSGKSCTIASLLQTALGKESHAPAGGGTFILFDTNGEYRRAVSQLTAPIQRIYARIMHSQAATPDPATPYDEREEMVKFRLPHWLLTLEEWELLLQASDKVQRPVLRNALGLTSLFANARPGPLPEIRNHILASCILQLLFDSENDTSSKSRIRGLLNVYESPEISKDTISAKLGISYGKYDERNLASLEVLLKGVLLPNCEIPAYLNQPFRFDDLQTALEMAILYEESHGNRRVRDYCSTLLTRVKSLQSRDEFEFMRLEPPSGNSQALVSPDRFVDSLLGIKHLRDEKKKYGQVFVLDLSTVEDEVVEVVSSVVTRLVFDRLRRSTTRNAYPVSLILEEAHRYVARLPATASTLDAKKIFERVAKEGRKYGLFLILSSQRPSELSGTVLSQCSNYVIHRIQNPEDLQHIRRMTPFISESVLNRLTSLPKQHALVFGTSVSIPTTFRVRTADPLPHSDDSDVSQYWYRTPEEVTPLP